MPDDGTVLGTPDVLKVKLSSLSKALFLHSYSEVCGCCQFVSVNKMWL